MQYFVKFLLGYLFAILIIIFLGPDPFDVIEEQLTQQSAATDEGWSSAAAADEGWAAFGEVKPRPSRPPPPRPAPPRPAPPSQPRVYIYIYYEMRHS